MWCDYMQDMIEESITRFEPSMKLLTRILKVILEQNSLGKTHLSQESKINYVRLNRLLYHRDFLNWKPKFMVSQVCM